MLSHGEWKCYGEWGWGPLDLKGTPGSHLGNCHWLKIISKHMKTKILILSLIFITWQTERLGGSALDLPPQEAILEIVTPLCQSSLFPKILWLKIISEQL